METVNTNAMKNCLFVKVQGRFVRLEMNDILYVEGCGKYLKIVTDKRQFLVLLTMKRMEHLLPADLFVRVHKSYIVSLQHMTEFDREVVCIGRQPIPIGSLYRGVVESMVLIAQEDCHEAPVAVPLKSAAPLATAM